MGLGRERRNIITRVFQEIPSSQMESSRQVQVQLGSTSESAIENRG